MLKNLIGQTGTRRKEIFEQAGIYTFSTQLAQFITLIAAVLSRRFLGPAQMGIWATLQIVVEYSKYSSLGAFYSVAREIPYLMGKGQMKRAEEIKNVVFTASLSGSSIIGLGIFLFAVITKGKLTTEITYGLFFVSGIVVLQRFNDLLVSLLRCYKQFALASTQMIWSGIVNAFLVSLLAYCFKIYGFMWAIGLSLIFNIVYLHMHNNFHFRFHLDFKKLWGIIQFGFPLLIIGIATTVLRSIDKIMIAKWLGFESLGLYSVAIMASAYIGSFSNAFSVVLVPHLQERFGVHDNPKDLTKFLYKASHACALTTSMLIGATYILGPFFVTLFLPKFTAGIEAMKTLSLSIFFFSLQQPYNDFLITIKKHFSLFPLVGITAAVGFLLNYWIIHSGFGITGVGYATAFTALINFSMTYFFSARYLDRIGGAAKEYFVFLGYCAYLLIVTFFINQRIPSDVHSFQNAVAQLLCFIAFCGPLIWLLNRKFALLSLLRQKLPGRNKMQGVSNLGISE